MPLQLKTNQLSLSFFLSSHSHEMAYIDETCPTAALEVPKPLTICVLLYKPITSMHQYCLYNKCYCYYIRILTLQLLFTFKATTAIITTINTTTAILSVTIGKTVECHLIMALLLKKKKKLLFKAVKKSPVAVLTSCVKLVVSSDSH